MKVLVTGATGKVGSRLVPYLLDRHHQVRVLVRDVSAPAAQALQGLGADVAMGDIMQPDSLVAPLADRDAVIHLAAYFRDTQNVDKIKDVNVTGTKNVAATALAANPAMRFIFTSTNLVYSNDAGPALESDAVNPQMAYPASKAEAEKLLQTLHAEAGLDVRIARLAFVYGAGDPHLEEAIPLFEQWKMHPAKRIHLVHHADIAQAIGLLLSGGGSPGQIYNIADDAPITLHEILQVLEKKADLPSASEPLANPWQGTVSTRKFRDQSGFRPLVPSLYHAQDLMGL